MYIRLQTLYSHWQAAAYQSIFSAVNERCVTADKHENESASLQYFVYTAES